MSSLITRLISICRPGRRQVATQALTTALLLLTLFSFGGSAAAQGTIIRQTTTTSAIAEGEVCLEGFEACSWVDMYIGPGKVAGTTWLCLSLSTGMDLYEEACADVTATFTMDADLLTYAELPATSLTFETQVCDKYGNCSDPIYRMVTVSASWVGAGNRDPIQEMLGDPHGSCTEMHLINGFVRPSSVTLSIDGQTADAYGNLQSLDAQQMRRTNCG
jgi:hypothetical protein